MLVDKRREVILADRRQTVQDVREGVGSSYRTVQNTLSDVLHCCKTCAETAERRTEKNIALLSAGSSKIIPEMTPNLFRSS
jgi:hypothetical protein